MSRTYARLALPLVLLMFMAGCIYSSTPEWGTGDGEVHVEIDDEDKTATIKSQLGNGFDKTVTLQCDAKEFTITGMIISSQIYDSHPDIEEGDIDSAMGASVIIHKMSWSQAEGVEEGSAERVKIKEWTSPLDPVEDGGLSKVDENSEDWEVLHVKGVLNVPLVDIVKNPSKIGHDSVLYCGNGHKSMAAVSYLLTKNIITTDITGGLSAMLVDSPDLEI